MTPALLVLLLGGLALRLTIAYVLFPQSGFESDLGVYRYWAETMLEHGPGGFYQAASFADYPPGYLYLLWGLWALATNIRIEGVAMADTDVLKTVPILFDLAVAYVLYRLVRGWAWPGPRAEAMALGAAALYLFLPLSWYDSALWGQTDAVGTAVLLLGVAALVRGNSEGAAALAALAALVKPQFGVVLLPLVAILLLRRHLVHPGSGPLNEPWGPAMVRGWLARRRGPVRLVTSAMVAIVVFHVVALPFGMGVMEYVAFVRRTADGYQWLTVNAFDPWALVSAAGQPSLADAFPYWTPDTAPFLGPIPAVVVGAGLLIAGFGWGLAHVWRHDERMSIVLVATFLALSFFVLPTRVHERYVFPAFALLCLLAVASRRWLVVLLVVTIAAAMNFHAVLTATNPPYGTPALRDLPPGALLRQPAFIVLSTLALTASFLVVGWTVRPWRRRITDGYELAAHEVDGEVRAGPLPLGVRPVGPSHEGPPVAATVGPGMATGPPPGVGSEAPIRGPGVGAWLAARFLTRPMRRDRSAELTGEPGGRLDRLDLVAVLLLLLASLSLRGYRLDQPYDMYFDEVYHARTGMEFLQHWRYGIDHGIYEYTHPHLAKYAMALGIELFGDHRVTARSELEAPVVDAALEVRWSPDDAPGERDGDRLYVATGTSVIAWDLRDRGSVATFDVPAVAVAVDPDAHRLFAVTADGAISSLDTTRLDALRRDGAAGLPAFETLGDAGTGAVSTSMDVVESSVIVGDRDGRLRTLDADTGERLGATRLADVAQLVALPSATRLVVRPTDVPERDRTSVADRLAFTLGDDGTDLARRLGMDVPELVLAAWLDADTRDEIQADIDDGLLPGVSFASGPIVAVASAEGVVLLDARSLDQVDLLDTGAASGVTLVRRGLDDPTLYASVGDELRTASVDSANGPSMGRSLRMPGVVGTLAWNDAVNLVHAVGTAPDGSPTVYVVDPHGLSVFADARLPYVPRALAMDTQPERPSQDRTELLAVSADGAVASVDVGGNAFGYRMPGVILGAVTAAGLYLLMRTLVRRRVAAVATGLLVLAEGMLFANARIAMNDVYVTAFVVLAVAVFAAVWLGRIRRPWLVAPALVVVGLLLGLALASKWVAAYAIGGMVLLMLLRSALGRFIALAGLVAVTAVLGALAIRPAEVDQPHRNWLFLLIMLAVTAAFAVAIVRRPVRMARDELWFLVGASGVLGTLALVAWLLVGAALPTEGLLQARTLLVAGIAGMALAVGSAMTAVVAGRSGRGPLAERRPVDPSAPVPGPPPRGWLRPGAWLGVPWLFAIACLVVLPIGVYAISYAPWVAMGNRWWTGFPVDHTGQTLWDLTVSMYRYHDQLRVGHAASSPWWAWPLDLKPVWFYQEDFLSGTTAHTRGVIYDGGNVVIFWMGIAALLFAAWAAWVRRSLPVTLIVILFAALWLPWSRIDRATFQYHWYTSLPFVVLALAYLVAELWHGPARVGWLLARVGGAMAILAPPLLWLARQPLCTLAGVSATSEACGPATRTAQLSEQAFWALLVLLVGGGVAIWQLWLAGRWSDRSRGSGLRLVGSTEGVIVTCGLTLLGIGAAVAMFGSEPAYTAEIGADVVAWLVLLLLLAPAWLVLRARDSRRFAAGLVTAAGLFLLAWYPNLSGLPLPDRFANVFQFLLPTWNYAFQFGVNTDSPPPGGLVDPTTIVVALAATTIAVGAAVAARLWVPRRDAAATESVGAEVT